MFMTWGKCFQWNNGKLRRLCKIVCFCWISSTTLKKVKLNIFCYERCNITIIFSMYFKYLDKQLYLILCQSTFNAKRVSPKRKIWSLTHHQKSENGHVLSGLVPIVPKLIRVGQKFGCTPLKAATEKSPSGGDESFVISSCLQTIPRYYCLRSGFRGNDQRGWCQGELTVQYGARGKVLRVTAVSGKVW